MSPILVTGAAGFIGMHVATGLLDAGHEVMGVDSLNDYYSVELKQARLSQLERHPSFGFQRLDLADRDEVRRLFAGREYPHVVHLAAQAGVRYATVNPAAYIDSNLVGFANLLEACRHGGCQHLVFASSSSVYGESVAMGRLLAGVPIASMIGDSHAALFGHAGFQPGAIKATYGTGSSLMTPTVTPIASQSGLATTVAWAQESGPTYALEGNIYVTGAAVEWLGQLLGLADGVNEIELMAADVADSGGAYFVPAFVGLGAPHWSDSARGLMTGLTRGTTSAHLARATLESIAYQIRDVFDVMQAEAGTELQMLLADGGPSRNDLLMQFQADIIGCPVVRSASPVVSALGAAYLAGLAIGVWGSEDEIASLPRGQERFEPRMARIEREHLYGGWRDAVARTVCSVG